MVGWDVCLHTTDGAEEVHRFYADDAQFHSLFHGSTATQRYMARTELFRRAGGWDPTVRYWDDIELGARVLALNPRVRHAGRCISVDVHAQEQSITGTRYSDSADKAAVALEAIRRTLGPEHAFPVDVKAAILAADCAKEGAAGTAKDIMNAALARYSDMRRRLILRAAYAWCRAGLRGAARILRPLL